MLEKIHEIVTTLGMPNFSIKAPPNGAIDANINSITAIADEISEIFQPKVFVNGMISTWGILTTAEENTVVKKVINAITQP